MNIDKESLSIEQKIIAGAAELFHQYGIRSVSMDDIARHLAISKKTIYQHYKDKNEVVQLSLKLHLEMNEREYDEIFETNHNPVEQLAQVSKCMRNDFKDINPSLLFDMQKYHPQAWQMWLGFKNQYIKNQVCENLKKGIKEGYYRPEIDPETLARLRVEQVQLAFDEKVYPREDFNLKDTQMMFFDHFVNGIVTDKGRELYNNYILEGLNEAK